MLSIGKRYSVYKVFRSGAHVWADDGMKQARSVGGHLSFAVRVLGLKPASLTRVGHMRDAYAVGVNGQGELVEVPFCSFGPRIPDCEYLPGAAILIDGRPYEVQVADDGVKGAWLEAYSVRSEKGGPSAILIKTTDGWVFGKDERFVSVQRYS